MIEYNSKLNNFFGSPALQIQTNFSTSKVIKFNFSIRIDGKIQVINPICPCCNSRAVVNNGNDFCKSKFIKELGLEIKRGKYKCKRCNKCWTIKFRELELFVD